MANSAHFLTRVFLILYAFIFQADLAEDLRLATLARRTKIEIYKLYAIRILVNLIVLGLLGVSAYLIFIASQLSVTVRNNNGLS